MNICVRFKSPQHTFRGGDDARDLLSRSPQAGLLPPLFWHKENQNELPSIRWRAVSNMTTMVCLGQEAALAALTNLDPLSLGLGADPKATVIAPLSMGWGISPQLNTLRFTRLVVQGSGKKWRNWGAGQRMTLASALELHPDLPDRALACLKQGVAQLASFCGLPPVAEDEGAVMFGDLRLDAFTSVKAGAGDVMALAAVSGSVRTNLRLEGEWQVGRLAHKGCGRLFLTFAKKL